ncbi:hypothetical protein C8J56DRAFT_140152 [Mycena floridula]|nr:hypothetical protein C8J56DRAFT_140152 [Mycena floridula]
MASLLDRAQANVVLCFTVLSVSLSGYIRQFIRLFSPMGAPGMALLSLSCTLVVVSGILLAARRLCRSRPRRWRSRSSNRGIGELEPSLPLIPVFYSMTENNSEMNRWLRSTTEEGFPVLIVPHSSKL